MLPDSYFTETVAFPAERSGWIDGRREETIRSSPRRRHEILHAERPGQDARPPPRRRGGLLPRAGAASPEGSRGTSPSRNAGGARSRRRSGRGGRRRARARARPAPGRRRDHRPFRRARGQGDRASRAGARGGRRAAQPVSAPIRVRRHAAGLLPAREAGGRAGLSRARSTRRTSTALARLRFRSAALVRGVPRRSGEALRFDDGQSLRVGREARRGHGRFRRRRPEAGSGRARALAVFPAARAAARSRDGPGASRERREPRRRADISGTGEADGDVHRASFPAARRSSPRERGAGEGDSRSSRRDARASSRYSPAPR